MKEKFKLKPEKYLNKLCVGISDRSVGSKGNREATSFFADQIRTFGFEVKTPEFECIDWHDQGSTLTCKENSFMVYTSPYSLGCEVEQELVVATTVDQLRALNINGKVLLLYGAIAKEQLMPKGFPFYNPAEHKEIYNLLEKGDPQAIVTATSKNPELAGAMYPFPMIEDGDFDISSVYMTDIEGERLAKMAGKKVNLSINSTRIPAKGFNVVAKKGTGIERIVVCAHIDSKKGTPGAIDNATGVIVLMLLAELLVEFEAKNTIEIVAFNGEDYYAAPGQLLYLADNKELFSTKDLVINLDGAGFHTGETAYSTYNCSGLTEELVTLAFKQYPGIIAGKQWIQSDHGMFVQMGIPAMAITSNHFMEKLAAEITHTPKDNPGIVDCAKLVIIARALHELLQKLNNSWKRR